MHGRSRMTIDPRIPPGVLKLSCTAVCRTTIDPRTPPTPGRSTSGFHWPSETLGGRRQLQSHIDRSAGIRSPYRVQPSGLPEDRDLIARGPGIESSPGSTPDMTQKALKQHGSNRGKLFGTRPRLRQGVRGRQADPVTITRIEKEPHPV